MCHKQEDRLSYYYCHYYYVSCCIVQLYGEKAGQSQGNEVHHEKASQGRNEEHDLRVELARSEEHRLRVEEENEKLKEENQRLRQDLANQKAAARRSLDEEEFLNDEEVLEYERQIEYELDQKMKVMLKKEWELELDTEKMKRRWAEEELEVEKYKRELAEEAMLRNQNKGIEALQHTRLTTYFYYILYTVQCDFVAKILEGQGLPIRHSTVGSCLRPGMVQRPIRPQRLIFWTLSQSL